VSYPNLLTPEQKLADGKALLGIPKIVVICGSTRFMQEMADADRELTWAGHIVVKPGCDMKTPNALWADPAEAEVGKVRLDGLHRAKIRLADEVLVVGGCVGDSTRAEIAYARELGKPVRFTHPEVDPITHDGFDLAGDPAVHYGPRERCCDPACEEAHVVADDSDDPETGTRLCGYGATHDGHEWTSRPDIWCPGS
jgi:hypothetical protein